MYILGIHGDFGKSGHDAAASLVLDGKIVAAAEEERFTRYKHAVGLMPTQAIRFCLEKAGITMKEVDCIAFPRETWTDFIPRFESYLWHNFGHVPPIRYVNHHFAHAASTYYVSGFERALVVSIDQAGDTLSAAVYRGNGKTLERIAESLFPNSIGLFAAFMTQYLGFRSNHDEYKVMGLASYGKPTYDLSHILSVTEGVITFDQSALHPTALVRHPQFHTNQMPLTHTDGLPGLPPRRLVDSPLLEDHKNLAASAQKAIEDAVIAYVSHYKGDEEYLCLAGGVAENSVANGKLAMSGMFKDIYLAPACGDAGTALGAAIAVGVENGMTFDRMETNKLGPEYSNTEIQELLEACGISYQKTDNLFDDVAELLAGQHIVAWFQGRMEFGPRALGSRSLIADPSTEEMRVRVNRIKRREQFRPFAPSILAEHAETLFPKQQASPFMSFTLPATEEGKKRIPAAIHVDYTGRLQTVADDGSHYRKLIEAFYKKTGVPAVLNTSLNSGWEPIVESPAQALAFFFSSEATALVLGDYIVLKSASR